MFTRVSVGVLIGAMATVGAAAPAMASPAAGEPNASVGTQSLNAYCNGRTLPLDCWVLEPTVNQSSASYPQIVFQHGDYVTITAGGCVQTGGRGKTWKRYVDPLADNGLYHGSYHIPGATGGLTNFQYTNGSKYYVGGSGGPLVLGYQDDGYSDNGYYSHDDGTGDQCKGVGSAWVHVVITAS
jgi:hypothetical protein